jgi:flagellar hook assembly protein FlgD
VGAWTCELVSTAVGDPVATRRFALAQNHPNPFNPATVIEFTVPEGGGEVFLEIFDVSGRLVRRLASGPRDAGTQSVIWQGRDESGRAVSSGVYYYRLRARDFEETRRMVLVR